MLVNVSPALKTLLRARGVESLHGPNARISSEAVFEPPCSIKWMQIENGLTLGAFSYAVSGYYSHVSIGRYTSIGEAVQIGRSSHALTWVGTSPTLYLRQKIFDVGTDFSGGEAYANYLPPQRPGAVTTTLKRTIVGNDVYIGHGAFIMPGVSIGDGAIVGAMAVVTKDVPPYAVVAGNPAKVVKMRFAESLVQKMLASKWWTYAPWEYEDIDMSQPEAAVDRFLAREDLEGYKPQLVRLSECT